MFKAQARLQELKWGEAGSAAPASLGSRVPALVGCPQPQERLSALAVAIIGCGSIGSGAAEDLIRSGVRKLLLVDPRPFKPESVWTHGIQPGEVGRPKAVAVGLRCKAINPAARVYAFTGHAQELPLGLLADVDVVLIATDNLAAEVAVGQACLHYGRPLLQASVHPETLVSQTRVWSNRGPAGPCPACAFGAMEWDQLQKQVQFSCEGYHSVDLVGQVIGQPTRSFRFLCSLSSNLLVNQLMRHVLELGKPVAETVLEYSGYTNQAVVSSLARNPQCQCEHSRWELRVAPRLLAKCSSKELAELAGMDGGQVLLTVGGAEFAEKGICACPAPKLVGRFTASAEDHLGLCPECHAPIRSHPAFLHRQISPRLMGPLFNQPLSEHGVSSSRAVLVQNGSRAVLLRDPEKSL